MGWCHPHLGRVIPALFSFSGDILTDIPRGGFHGDSIPCQADNHYIKQRTGDRGHKDWVRCLALTSGAGAACGCKEQAEEGACCTQIVGSPWAPRTMSWADTMEDRAGNVGGKHGWSAFDVIVSHLNSPVYTREGPCETHFVYGETKT